MIKTFLGGISSFFSVSQLISITNQRLFLPFYHVVSDQRLSHISNLYTIRSIDQFEKEIDFFLSHFEAISLESLHQIVHSRDKIRSPKMHLTFDDGLKECFTIITPILKKKGVTATFFLNSAFVDNKDLFYRYKASLLIEEIEKSNINWSRFEHIGLTQQNYFDKLRNSSIHDLDWIDEMAIQLDVDFSLFLEKEKPYLTSDQINKMLDDGFTFGSHSDTHPLYSDISFQEQIIQTEKSLKFLNDNFPQKLRSFSFPFSDENVSKLWFDQLKNQIDLSFGVSGLKQDYLLNHMHRYPVESYPSDICKELKIEYLYFAMKSIFGKNKIKRI